MAGLVPGGRGAEKPRVFLWEAAAAAVRVVGTADAPWFVAKDVCAALGIANYRDAVSSLEEDEKGVALTDTLGGAQEMATVNESGLYALIFRSRKEQARVFRKWVTSEVLPQIRKAGRYALNRADYEQPNLIYTGPARIDIHYHPQPPEKIPDEQEVICCLLGVVLGLGKPQRVVHSSTIFDLAVREDVLSDWVGGHRLEWQRRSRFFRRLRAYFSRWLQSAVVGRYFWISPTGHGRARRYQIALREEQPRAGVSTVGTAEATEIVARALGQGAEVIAK